MSYTGYFLDTPYRVIDGRIVYAKDDNNPRAAISLGFASLVSDIQTGATILTATDTGTVNAYVMNLTAVPDSLADGLEVWLKPAVTNTGASTLNLNDLGAKAIRAMVRSALVGGELVAGYWFKLKYIASVDSFLIVSERGRTEIDSSRDVIGAGGTSVTTTDTEIIVHSASGRKNYLINGNFDVWQRATSQTSSGYGSDDRWLNEHSGITKTHSQQAFALGQTLVPGNPKYFSRTVVTNVAGAGNYCRKSQRIENVTTNAGGKVTCSFWFDTNASRNIAVEFVQNFGTGGSPSAEVTGIGVQLVAVTPGFKKYTVTVDLPSIAGKTLGSDNNDYLAMVFWFNAGSSFNARTATLGQQSGTFDLAQVQFEEGAVATEFERLTPGEILSAVERFYQTGIGNIFSGNVTSGSNYYIRTKLRTAMRANPSVVLTNMSVVNFPSSTGSVTVQSPDLFLELRAANGTGAGNYSSSFTADAEL